MGERAVLVEAGAIDDVHRLWSSLRAHRPAGAEDVVAGGATVLVVARPGTDLARLASEIGRRSLGPAASSSGRDVTIPVAYDGPDLEEVARITGLTPGDVAARHSGACYPTAFIGFSPGFAYLTGLAPELRVPRLATPRKAVPAGSVAIAGEMTAVYPHATPGGWRLIGRAGTLMFDPDRPEPSLLMPGDRVRFEPVAAVSPQPAPLRPPGQVEGPRLTVLEAGPWATVQDLGRIGWAHAGVPRGGVLDRSSAAHANRLVGNQPGVAVIESAFAGLRLRLSESRLVSFTGARAEVTVDGIPARQDAALPLPSGCEILVSRPRAGARVYIAVEGGLAVDPVLGSRSTDTLSGLGPASLAEVESLPLGPMSPGERTGPPASRTGSYPVPGDTVEVRAIVGPRSGWITGAGLDRLADAEFVVEPSSDRTGIRLRGPVVERGAGKELVSEGMVAGAVQVPPDGQPIVLMRNHPATGGYPVAAVVDDAGVDRLAQAPPGVRVRFRLAPPAI